MDVITSPVAVLNMKKNTFLLNIFNFFASSAVFSHAIYDYFNSTVILFDFQFPFYFIYIILPEIRLIAIIITSLFLFLV